MRITQYVVAALVLSLAIRNLSAAPATAPAEFPSTAPSRISSVTVYQGSALVTREVQVPAGSGQMVLVVSPLPEQTIDNSLYSESSDGIRILSTRFRTRALEEDMRAEVRSKEQQIKTLQLDAEKLQKQVQVIELNLALLAKLENFTSATMQQLTEKGLLNADATIALAKYVAQERAEKSDLQISLQQKIRANSELQNFAKRELSEITAGASRTQRDAVIVIDKTGPAAGTVHLNYLVSSAGWSPQYKFRATGEDGPVQVEYLAAIVQQSGEDWSNAGIVLSTAEPLLSAAPPELAVLDMTITRLGAPGGGGKGPLLGKEAYDQVQQLRSQARQRVLENDYAQANVSYNTAAALAQTDELLNAATTSPTDSNAPHEGPSVTYHLKNRYTIPSRNDEQLIEVARLELPGEFFYKAVPVLTPHLYRLANLTNSSEYVLLPGQATMYLGPDFVGRMDLPLIAVGKQFTAGFGVDPQLQVARELVKKDRSVQGGNQVHDFSYRIAVSSFKSKPVKMQVWDRLPHAEAEAVGISLTNSIPALSTDATYVRVDRPKNLLRWDLTVPANANGEKSVAVEYQFKLEYDRNVALGNFKAGQ